MKILLTGATGYIGRRLIPALLDIGHEVVCCVRDKNRFISTVDLNQNLTILEADFVKGLPSRYSHSDIDIAFYLIHSMSSSESDFEKLEATAAQNFNKFVEDSGVRQVIYLSGIINDKQLSKHLRSRKQVESILAEGNFSLTTLRAGIIVGSGSASFEIIRDLVEKLPVMVTPKWLKTRSQPIAVRNVLQYLTGVIGKEFTYGKSYDIGGPEVLTYKEMLQQFAKVRGLKRYILTLPVLSPRLSSYWLYFVTSTSYSLAKSLVASMKIEVICSENNLNAILGIELISYQAAIEKAFEKIINNEIPSSWIDAQSSNTLEVGISKLSEVPTFGCFVDHREMNISDVNSSLEKIWSIGGENGWYYANWLWVLRGIMDKVLGGVGLRRGRKNLTEINAGDSLDFWRVLYASKSEKRLLLYAEMKLPGEAWLEFKINNDILIQTATFRPLGVLGRLYWYSVLPFHHFIFGGMIKKIGEN